MLRSYARCNSCWGDVPDEVEPDKVCLRLALLLKHFHRSWDAEKRSQNGQVANLFPGFGAGMNGGKGRPNAAASKLDGLVVLRAMISVRSFPVCSAPRAC